MDISGEVQLEVDHDVYKRRLSADGTPLDDGAWASNFSRFC
jgi:hypothetical protein